MTKHLWRVQPSSEVTLMQLPEGMAQKGKEQEPALPTVWVHPHCLHLLAGPEIRPESHTIPRQAVFTIIFARPKLIQHLSGGLCLQTGSGHSGPIELLLQHTLEWWCWVLDFSLEISVGFGVLPPFP